MVSRRPVRISPVLAHPAYFKSTASQMVHRVRTVQRIDWGDGKPWLAIEFSCAGLSTDDKGTWHAAPPPDVAVCRRCLAAPPPGQARRSRRPARYRRRPLGDLANTDGLVPFEADPAG